MSAPLKWAPLLKGRKLNERPVAHSDKYGIGVGSVRVYKSAISTYSFGKTKFSSLYVLFFSCFCIFRFSFLILVYVFN